MDHKDIHQRIHGELESEDYKKEYDRHLDILNSFLQALVFIRMNCERSTELKNSLFCLSVIDDLLQSLVAIKVLGGEGIRNTCRRELRYIIELSIKACLISQKWSDKPNEEQISVFRDVLKDTNISMIKDINFHFFDEDNKEAFIIEAKRFYGQMCSYVHATSSQMIERISLDKEQRYIGFEGINELKELNDEIGKALYISLVLFFHAIPTWCVGDYLVERDGRTVKTYFSKFKLFSVIVQYFDYKCERQSILHELQTLRKTRICF